MTKSVIVSSFIQLIYGLLKELSIAMQQIDGITIVYKILTHLSFHFDYFVCVVHNERNIPLVLELFSRLHLEDSNFKLHSRNLQKETLMMRIKNVIWGSRTRNPWRGTYCNFPQG